MATKIWHYFINTILVVTMNSYRAMRLIAAFTLAALNKPTDTFIYGLYTNLLPFVTAFNLAYSTWIAALGMQISSTLSFYEENLSLGSSDIKDWDILIQGVYKKGTVGYKALLPHGRKPFQTGSQEDKVSACEALAIALFGIVALGAVLTLVNAKIVLLNNAKNAKDTGKSNTGFDSGTVESTRVTLAGELYGTLNMLMYHFRMNPSLIIPFFNVMAIRNLGQTIWRRTLKGLAGSWLFTRTFVATDNLRLVNNSLYTIRFSMVPLKGSPIGLVFYDLPPMSSATVNVLLFGPLGNHNMIAQNLGAGEAKFILVII
jgi:hypothetical protein